MNILAPFLERAEGFGDPAAIIEPDGRRIGFGEIARISGRVAAAWRALGLHRGDRVLIAMPLGIDLYIGLAALWRLGAVAVFPEPALGLKGLRHAAEVTRPAAYLTGGWYGLLRFALPELRRVPLVLRVRPGTAAKSSLEDVGADAPALISFTSGSTGKPKGIVRSHGFLAAQNARVGELLASDRHQTDLVAFPVFVIANLALGNTSVLPNWPLRRHDKADAGRIITFARQHGISRALVPPSICEILVNSRAALPFGTIFTGGGPVFPDVVGALRAQTPDLRLVSVYGSTEAEPIAHLEADAVSDDDLAAMQRGGGLLAGHPIEAIKLRIIDDEIVVTGDHVNKGYLDPARNASTKITLEGAIWHRTGDAGRLDDAGRLWLLGRLDGRVGALFPFAVETAARIWPGVARAALLGTDKGAVLAIEGEQQFAAEWQRRAEAIGAITVRRVATIPLDARHRSKVDYIALKRLLT